MNHWHIEAMAELQRRGIEHEMKDIRLAERAATARLYRPGWFARGMFGFANWMILTGKDLRRRYEVPVAGCSQVGAKSLAR